MWMSCCEFQQVEFPGMKRLKHFLKNEKRNCEQRSGLLGCERIGSTVCPSNRKHPSAFLSAQIFAGSVVGKRRGSTQRCYAIASLGETERHRNERSLESSWCVESGVERNYSDRPLARCSSTAAVHLRFTSCG